MQANSRNQLDHRLGVSKSHSESLWLTIIGLTTDGHFFREKVGYSLEVDGFHLQTIHSMTEKSFVLLEIENPDPKILPTAVNAEVRSVQPSSSTPGMFEVIAQRDATQAPTKLAPRSNAPAAASLRAVPAVVKPANTAPLPVAPQTPAAALPHAPAQPLQLAPVPAIPQVQEGPGMEAFASAIGFEEDGVGKATTPKPSSISQASLQDAIRACAEPLIREQLATRMESLAEEWLRQRLEQLTPNLDDLSSQLKNRIRGEYDQLANEIRETLRVTFEKEAEESKSQAASAAIIFERLRSQTATDFEVQKADFRDWVVSVQESQARSAGSAVEAELAKIRSQIQSEFDSKLAAAQSGLDGRLEQARQLVTELLNQVDKSRMAGLSSVAEVSQAQTQLTLLRQSLKTEVEMAEGRLAAGIQDAMLRLEAEAKIRMSFGLHQVDSGMQTKLATFRDSLSQQIEAAQGRSAGLLNELEDCRSQASQALQTLDTVHATIDQVREAWHVEMQAEETKLKNVSQRALTCASAETTRLLNWALENLEKRLRERTGEMESSCQEIASRAGQQLEKSAAGVKKSEAAAAVLLANVDASLSRSTQTFDALNQLQASITTDVKQMLATDSRNLFVQFQKQLNDQCKRLVELHISSLGKRAAQQMQSVEQAWQRLSGERATTEATCRTHQDALRMEVAKTMEDFRTRMAQTTEQMRLEMENATRQAHEALEQEFSVKLKYLAENTANLARTPFHSPPQSK